MVKKSKKKINEELGYVNPENGLAGYGQGAELAIKKQQAYIDHVMRVTAIASDGRSNKDISVLADRFRRYLEDCRETGNKAGNMAAYAAMGVSKEIMHAWSTGRKGTSEQQEFARRVRGCLAAYRETLATNGDINVVWAIFTAKNFDGMTDGPKWQSLDEGLDSRPSASEIKAKYQDLLGE